MAYLFFAIIIVGLVVALYPASKKKATIQLSFIINNIKIKGGIIMVQLKDTQKVTGLLAPVDAKGNTATVQAGSVVVTSSDESVVTVEKDASNELGFTLVAGKPGTAQVDFSADADLGDGVTTIAGFTAVEVQAGDAVGMGASFGEPTAQ
jgi:hypothetical protein